MAGSQAHGMDVDEQERLLALHALRILDTDFEERFDRVTRLAASVFDAPIVAVSLVDTDRQWFKSCVGLEERETSRDISFCAHAIRRDEALVVEDALRDPRFADYENVRGGPQIRFYAGQPLYLPDGHKPGTLCVIDTKPRGDFGDSDRANLRDLASIVERELVFEDAEVAFSELAETSRRLRGVMSSTPAGIVVLGRGGRVENVNRAAAAMLGRPAGAPTGRDLHEMLHPEACPGDCRLIEALGSDELIRREESFQRADGSTVPVEFAISPLGGGDAEEGGAVLTFRDVSDRLELDHIKGEFFAQITHDLRSPLTSIEGFTTMVREGVLGQINVEQGLYLDRALAGAGRLEGLIDNLLAVARLERPELELVSAPLDLAVRLREIVASFSASAERRGQRLELEVPEALGMTGDGALLDRAIANLISNALKFSPDGGIVTITLVKRNRRCVLSVADSGPGIPAEEIPRVGQRFFRASTATGTPGTGLGLAIARQVAELHGGDLVIESDPGAGATFSLRLPAAA